jgi:hypothetical protein
MTVPHFDYPFRFGAAGHAVTVEQDEPDEVRNCCLAILKTPIGARLDLPAFGTPDQLFREGGVDGNTILSVLRRWEARAEFAMDVQEIRNMAQTVTVTPTLRGGDDG